MHCRTQVFRRIKEAHGDKNLLNEGQFRALKKCDGKFDCLIYEKLLIKELRPIALAPRVTP